MPARTQASGKDGSCSTHGTGKELEFGVESRGLEGGVYSRTGGESRKGTFLVKCSSDFTGDHQRLMGILSCSCTGNDRTPSISREESSERIAVLTNHTPGPLTSRLVLQWTQPVSDVEVQGNLCQPGARVECPVVNNS